MSEIIQYKCPHCDGRVEFSSETQTMKCPYCDSEFSVDEAVIVTQENVKADEAQAHTGLKTYICQSCGGEIVTEENTSATSCPFCDNPIILCENVQGDFSPKQIIPFKVSKNDAKSLLASHYKNKPYLPDAFSDENHLDEIKGIYVPYWIYNVSTTAQVNYECRRNTHHRRNASGGYYEITDSAVFDVMRKGIIHFKNVPADASKKMDDKMMDSIEPFDFRESVPFETAYLSGFTADKYDETSDELKERVRLRVENGARSAMESTVNGYDTKHNTYTNISLNHTEDPYYMLCPVWILNTTFNAENFRFAVNGQTGKIVGKLPSDPKKKRKIFFRDFAISGSIAIALWTIIQILGGLF